MSYSPATDFLALARQTSGGVRLEQMPGLDYALAALSRAGLISLWVGATAPIANPATTVWLVPASPSWSAEGAVLLWNGTAWVAATQALWSNLIAEPFISLIPLPGTITPVADGVGAAGVSLLYARQDHQHPTDPSRAPLNSPVLTGTPQAPTPTIGDNSTNIATTAYVVSAGIGPAAVQIGSVIPYAGSSAPNSNWAICNGSTFSRTGATATLFGIIGVTYGSGDGVTTANLPDLRGRTVAGVDGGVNRLTTATMSSQALGGTGGQETRALSSTANLPSYTPAGSVTVTATAGTNGSALSVFSGGGTFGFATGAANTTGNLFGGPAGYTLSGSFSGTAVGSGTAFGIVQPTIELNYIIRIS